MVKCYDISIQYILMRSDVLKEYLVIRETIKDITSIGKKLMDTKHT